MDNRDLLTELRAALDEGRAPSPGLRAALLTAEDPATIRQAGRLLAKARPAGGELRPARVTIAATCTVGSFPYLLRAALVGAGAAADLSTTGYGTFDVSLGTAAFAADGDPDLVACLLDAEYFLPSGWSAVGLDALGDYVESRLAGLRELIAAALVRSATTLVVHTVPLPATVRDAVISVRARARLGAIWHRLNAGLLDLAEEHRQVASVDLAGELADAPAAVRDERLYRYGDLPYTDGALLALAHQVRRVLQAKLGLSRKVLALDLDNTLWGGVLGEVGSTGVQLGGLYPGNCYSDLQRTAGRLREQGVILVLVSKNDPEPVDRTLAEHPEMVLRAADFAARAVNWTAKVDNLRATAETLGLSTDAFVFMDDSPFELGHVAARLPGVARVSAGGDPAYLIRSLLRSGWFDVPDVTDTDRQRPALYQSRALRADFSQSFASSDEYLRALDIQVTAEPVTPYTVARVAQLAARTNQFNLTGTRFDEARTAAMMNDPDHFVASFSVIDRFGAEGVVGAAWLECEPQQWRVLNLVLSCRVLSRGVELAVAGWLARRARQAGARALLGRYVPTGRNAVAADFWTRAGFAATKDARLFLLDLADSADPTPDWIALRDEGASHE
jgi:FkbH-like protein